METLEIKTDMHCKNCIIKVEPILQSDQNIKNWRFDLDHSDKLVYVEGENIDVSRLLSKISIAGYNAEILNGNDKNHTSIISKMKSGFWSNPKNWTRASFNTLNCLIGCTIGDFAMVVFIQANFPGTSMAIQMILATVAGLITSVMLETIILKKREKFDWSLALKTAFSMSFISMIGMELAMNTMDFMITGGKASLGSVNYWLAFFPALIAGFSFPLPYNYYKLQKFGKSCH